MKSIQTSTFDMAVEAARELPEDVREGIGADLIAQVRSCSTSLLSDAQRVEIQRRLANPGLAGWTDTGVDTDGPVLWTPSDQHHPALFEPGPVRPWTNGSPPLRFPSKGSQHLQCRSG